MKIAIDISQTIFGTGVSTYTSNLVRGLLKNDPDDKYILFGGSMRRFVELKTLTGNFTGNFESKIFPYPPALADLIWNRLHILPVEKLIGQVDVVHTSDWEEPLSSAFKVTTIHDLYPFKFPRMVHPKILAVHKRKFAWVIRESKRIIVPSESTKEDLIKLGVAENIIRYIPEAPSLVKADSKQVDSVKKKYNLSGDYVISIGVTPLKNTNRITEAFHLSRAGKDLKLVLAGRPSDVGVTEERNVRILGYVPQDDLAALLTGSRALIFASLYEGFGIPILDAFACGVPVVTSNTGSMPEIAGDAAVLVDPYDVDSIKEGIEDVLRGPKNFIEKGFERVKEFSWDKTAKMTLDVYKEGKKC
ncbi:MAG TPA: glycosyltransferase family 1 protein [Candidatus Saccharimonadales bacterium]|nr:glycosyltransferase family 1 protein [Candidatus Saccharimonadales bacterium]